MMARAFSGGLSLGTAAEDEPEDEPANTMCTVKAPPESQRLSQGNTGGHTADQKLKHYGIATIELCSIIMGTG